MPLAMDHGKLKDILTDTIMTLCRNGLNYQEELRIEGLLGITIDREDIFLVNINKHIKTVISDVPQPRTELTSQTEIARNHHVQAKAQKRPFEDDNDIGSETNTETIEPKAKRQQLDIASNGDMACISDGKATAKW